ncbi:MAG: hypothetical protein RIQ52_224 [Pseudomonadota bacterium]|jgi:hypothetical protein
MKPDEYVGIDEDRFGGMTDIGRIIRDAWAFGLIPESERCQGWRSQAIEQLWQKVQDAWSAAGYQVSNLPEETRERFMRIQAQAVERARASGWNPDLLDDD